MESQKQCNRCLENLEEHITQDGSYYICKTCNEVILK